MLSSHAVVAISGHLMPREASGRSKPSIYTSPQSLFFSQPKNISLSAGSEGFGGSAFHFTIMMSFDAYATDATFLILRAIPRYRGASSFLAHPPLRHFLDHHLIDDAVS